MYAAGGALHVADEEIVLLGGRQHVDGVGAAALRDGRERARAHVIAVRLPVGGVGEAGVGVTPAQDSEVDGPVVVRPRSGREGAPAEVRRIHLREAAIAQPVDQVLGTVDVLNGSATGEDVLERDRHAADRGSELPAHLVAVEHVVVAGDVVPRERGSAGDRLSCGVALGRLAAHRFPWIAIEGVELILDLLSVHGAPRWCT
jgi:hypothetical protein